MGILNNRYALKKRLIAIAAVMFMHPQAVANNETTDATLKMKEPLLIASPNVCELSKGSYLCEMKAAIIWEMPTAGHYCLFEQGIELPLQCWRDSWSGSHVLTFQSDKRLTFELRAYQNDHTIGQATINVIGTLEQRIRAKRRRSFFRIF
ncbi:DUF3019 domain-containing protein [Thalassotalea atypica]|uniref:DUF3019 domain-containing protein n=1 Tax=Thalassotalea atypica TaxID=2054316 RepID=UPI0025731C7F|nr:DUF3019 domain-containing protein [Thalassotalea atypica]